MFNKTVCFLLGAVVGSGLTYIFVNNKAEARAQSDINMFKAEYKKREKELFEKYNKPNEPDDEVHQNCSFHVGNKPEINELLAKKKDKIDYRKFAHSYMKNNEQDDEVELGDPDETSYEPEDDDEDYTPIDIHPTEGPIDNPYTITPEEFANTNPYFDKITLTYYDFNDEVYDEDEEIIDDPVRILGTAYRNGFGEYEEDVEYIRNEKLGADFEVIREHTLAPE